MSDISKYTVVETKGWRHENNDKLFGTKEEADHDWAVGIFKLYVTECSNYNDFDDDEFVEQIAKCEDLREALAILGKFMIKYPR